MELNVLRLDRVLGLNAARTLDGDFFAPVINIEDASNKSPGGDVGVTSGTCMCGCWTICLLSRLLRGRAASQQASANHKAEPILRIEITYAGLRVGLFDRLDHLPPKRGVYDRLHSRR